MKDIYHKEWFSKQAFITKIEKDYLKIDYRNVHLMFLMKARCAYFFHMN